MTPKLLPIFFVLASGTALAQTAGAPPPAPARPAANSPRPGAAPAAAPAGQAETPERTFADWDKDKNGQLSLTEFKNGVEMARVTEIIGRLEQQFRKADKDASHYLEPAEYAALPIIQRAGGGAPPFATFDADHDQKLDFGEYLGLFQAMLKRNAAGK